MTQLYSVTIHRKKVITKYLDPKGKKTETYEEVITETYHDLPMATAQGYKKLDPLAQIIAQQDRIDRFEKIKGSFHVKGDSTAERYGKRRTKIEDDVLVVAETPKVGAATYADVVNEMMKEHQ